eukprot:scaffold832_cov403-Prasinococcus_capsulatus_cf.AAC.4
MLLAWVCSNRARFQRGYVRAGSSILCSGVERLGTGHAGAVRYYTVYPKLLNDPLKVRQQQDINSI